MSFDTHWLHFEIIHGPQDPGAKEDALFWYKKGASDEGKDIDALKGEIEDLKHDLSVTEDERDRALNNLAHVFDRVRAFANVDTPEDPLTKENLLEFLEILK